ncbi:ParB/RepB/Spo0J family partition protein [Candidatus Pelagibacter sp.]|uniref:ParB/RepB/Spo0J family partition protein n=1 Tax=Candidatus Pelagibacter sp. TaxID=2024849 RepID=UPI003F83755E
MNKLRKGLGRGLSSLIGETKKNNSINKVSINDLFKNRYQPRKIFDETKLQELVNSIQERGILQPIVVRNHNNIEGKYEIIAGERRWLAAKKAGLAEVPVVITEADDLKSLEFSIIENVQRDDLNPLEEAQSYQRLIDEFSYDHEKVSKFIGKSRSYITNSLRILTLPQKVLNLIEERKITSGHAKILVGLDNAEFIAEKIFNKKLSVRQAENFVKIFKKKNSLKSRDTNVQSLENSLIEKIGLKVIINNNKRNSGSIKIEYKNLEQLDRIIETLKKNY